MTSRAFFPVAVRRRFFVFQEDDTKSVKLTSRERRFIRFASVEYDGQLYMTPQDFLESVVEAEPRREHVPIFTWPAFEFSLFSFSARLKRKQLTPKDIESIREATPTLNQGSPRLFRNLRDKGSGCMCYRL